MLQSASWPTAQVWSFALHRDGNTLAVELTDKDSKKEPWIELVHVATGKTIKSLPMASAPWTDFEHMNLARIAFSPDGHLLAAAGWGTRPYVWDTATGKEVLRLKGQPPTVYSVAFSPNGKVLATRAYRGDRQGVLESSIRFWDVASG